MLFKIKYKLGASDYVNTDIVYTDNSESAIRKFWFTVTGFSDGRPVRRVNDRRNYTIIEVSEEGDIWDMLNRSYFYTNDGNPTITLNTNAGNIVVNDDITGDFYSYTANYTVDYANYTNNYTVDYANYVTNYTSNASYWNTIRN